MSVVRPPQPVELSPMQNTTDNNSRFYRLVLLMLVFIVFVTLTIVLIIQFNNNVNNCATITTTRLKNILPASATSTCTTCEESYAPDAFQEKFVAATSTPPHVVQPAQPEEATPARVEDEPADIFGSHVLFYSPSS
jgi:hypothetical protein